MGDGPTRQGKEKKTWVRHLHRGDRAWLIDEVFIGPDRRILIKVGSRTGLRNRTEID
jgi:hypothetical protein